MRKIYGFTLVELIIVVSIIGVLASAITLTIGNQQRAARDARRKSDLQTIKKALEKEEFETSTLVVNVGDRSTDCADNGWQPVANCAAGSHLRAWTNNFINQSYLATVPIDPENRQPRRIVYSSNTPAVRTVTMSCMYYRFDTNGFSAADDQFAYKLSAMMESDWQAPGTDNGTHTTLVNARRSYEVFVGASAQANDTAYQIDTTIASCL